MNLCPCVIETPVEPEPCVPKLIGTTNSAADYLNRQRNLKVCGGYHTVSPRAIIYNVIVQEKPIDLCNCE